MIVAGYITATTVYLARVRRASDEVRLSSQTAYQTSEFSKFDLLLKQYMKKIKGDVEFVCLGVAGPVLKGEVSPTNLPWHISASEIESQFNVGRVKIVNDLVATAHGLKHLSSEKLISVNKGTKAIDGNIGLIAPGDGLGESLIYNDGDKLYPYASEGGHTDFAPGNQNEADLWTYLYSQTGHVETEDILSCRGLESIYRFITERDGHELPKWFTSADDRPTKIMEMSLSGRDERASEAVELFLDCFASEAANLALKGMTIGGIYLAGMLSKQFITTIDKKRFMKRFVKQGKMEEILKKIPISIIIDEKTALLGAGSLGLEKVQK